jgi:hypothetical protein
LRHAAAASVAQAGGSSSETNAPSPAASSTWQPSNDARIASSRGAPGSTQAVTFSTRRHNFSSGRAARNGATVSRATPEIGQR